MPQGEEIPLEQGHERGVPPILEIVILPQGWQVSAEGGLNRGLNLSGRNRFLPVSANVNFDVNL